MHPNNRSGRKTLDRVAADPRVEEVWSEGEDGYWAALQPGFNAEGCSCLHEWKVKDLVDALERIEVGEPY